MVKLWRQWKSYKRMSLILMPKSSSGDKCISKPQNSPYSLKVVFHKVSIFFFCLFHCLSFKTWLLTTDNYNLHAHTHTHTHTQIKKYLLLMIGNNESCYIAFPTSQIVLNLSSCILSCHFNCRWLHNLVVLICLWI